MATATRRMALKVPKVHREDWMLVHDEAGVERLIPEKLMLHMNNMGAVPDREVLGDWRKLAQQSYKTIAGYNDPLACFIVVRELCKLKPAQHITSKKLGARLAAVAPQFIWTTVTLGRILGGLAEFAEETARTQDREELPYVQRVRLGSGPVYIMWEAPQTYIFLHAILEALAREVEKAFARVDAGRSPVTRDNIWYEIDPDFSRLG